MLSRCLQPGSINPFPPQLLLSQVLILYGESLRGCAYWVAVSIKINTYSSLSEIRAQQVLALIGQGQAQCLSVQKGIKRSLFLAHSPSYPALAEGWKVGISSLVIGVAFLIAVSEPSVLWGPWEAWPHHGRSVWVFLTWRPADTPSHLQDRVGKEAQWVDCHLSLIFTRHVQCELQIQKTINHVLVLEKVI